MNGGGDPALQPTVGSLVQWTSGGVDQFTTPLKVVGLSDDGEYAFVEGGQTGLPMAELSVIDAPADASNPKPPTTAGKGPPPANPFYKQPPASSLNGPRIEFALPNDNAIEIRLKKPVSKKDFDRIIKLVQLSEDALIGSDAE